MEEHKELREMIANGKDRLEWTRKVDQGQVFHYIMILMMMVVGVRVNNCFSGLVESTGTSHLKCQLGHLWFTYLVILCSSPPFESPFLLR